MWTSKIAVASIFLALLSLVGSAYVKSGNSLVPPYTDESDSMMYWDLTGSAQLAGSFIRLTTDEEEKQGGIWNNIPVLSNNWELQSHFHIHGRGINLNGDGMAFWYVRDALHQGPVFGSKDYFSGLGVFIDTFENQGEPHKHRHPYISAMVNNGSLHYEHDEDGTWTQIGGCHVPVRNLEVPTRIAISYIDRILAVYLDFEGFGQWRLCFRSVGVHLPTGYHFGITASTSDVTDNHDVIAATALNMDPEGHQWEDRKHIIPEAENVLIPERYHKDNIEEEEQNVVEKREIKEEVAEEVQAEKEAEIHREAERNAEMQREAERKAEMHREAERKAEMHREAERKAEMHREAERKAEMHREAERKAEIHREAEREAEAGKKAETTSEDASPPSTSLLRKLIYLIGAAIIIYIGISMYRKYSERRRERMQKRLF